MKAPFGIALIAATALAGCTTMSAAPVEVTRFHLGAPLERGSFTVEPASGGGGLEFATYANAVGGELAAAGYTAPTTPATAQYLAVVGISRTEREGTPRRSGLSIGLGGGGYTGGVGLGGGISLPIGKRGGREIVFSEMSVQLRRRTDGTVIWEGRAQTV